MKSRTLFASFLAAVVIAGVPASFSIPVAAQAQKASAQKAAPAAKTPAKPVAAVRRTADGHPDLSGTYDIATITPIERPAEAGGRLVITDEEAAAAAAYEVQR